MKNSQQKTISNQKIQQAVNNNFKKYKKTYQLLDKYDKSPQTAPQYPAERKALQDALQDLSS